MLVPIRNFIFKKVNTQIYRFFLQELYHIKLWRINIVEIRY